VPVEGQEAGTRIHWTGEKPADWAEWESIIRGVMRQWRAGGEVAIEATDGGWRVAAALADTEPRDVKRDNARRHRVTEALRARGKPAGLNRVAPA
jgi:hypothetical protein